jgi:hypothetical protein
MFQRLDDIQKRLKVPLKAWELVAVIVKICTILGSVALPVWAALGSTWLAVYGPIAWVGAGAGGLLCLAALMALYAHYRTYMATARTMEERLAIKDVVNPLDSNFDSKRISLDKLVFPVDKSITNKAFHRCEIIGPAIVFITGPMQSYFLDSEIINCDHVAVKQGVYVYNAIKFIGCSFNRCRLIGLTFLIPENAAHTLSDKAHWITSIPAKSAPV